MILLNRPSFVKSGVCLIGLLVAAGCSGAGNSNTPSNTSAANAKPASASAAPDANAVRASVSELKLAAGASGEAVVSVNIAQGFHANSNDPGDKFLIPTQLEVREADGLKAGAPAYPAGVTKKFGFSEMPLNVYEGTVQIKLPVTASAAKGRRTLDTNLTVQPCSDTECFPPRKINVAIPVVVE